jgi:hypothetical protein
VTDGLKAVPFKAQLSKHNSQSSYHLKAAIISKQLSSQSSYQRTRTQSAPETLPRCKRREGTADIERKLFAPRPKINEKPLKYAAIFAACGAFCG